MKLSKLRGYTMREIITVAYRRVFIEALPLFWGRLHFKVQSLFWGIKCGKNIAVWGKVAVIKAPGTTIEIGNNVSMVSSSIRATASALYAGIKLRTFERGSKIMIADNAGLNGTSITARSKTISIGKGAMIGPNVSIVDSDFHALWPPETRAVNQGLENDADVAIGRNVWVGMNSMVLKGVSIGDNSVIGAGSVVAGDIPPDCVAAGNPAKVIKKLTFSGK